MQPGGAGAHPGRSPQKMLDPSYIQNAGGRRLLANQGKRRGCFAEPLLPRRDHFFSFQIVNDRLALHDREQIIGK